MSSKNQELLKEVTAVVRALVISLQHRPVTLRMIERDYFLMEHTIIPYTVLGFKSSLELLISTNEFYFETEGCEILMKAKYNQKTEHLTNFIDKQTGPKSAPYTSRQMGNHSLYNNKENYNASSNNSPAGMNKSRANFEPAGRPNAPAGRPALHTVEMNGRAVAATAESNLDSVNSIFKTAATEAIATSISSNTGAAGIREPQLRPILGNSVSQGTTANEKIDHTYAIVEQPAAIPLASILTVNEDLCLTPEMQKKMMWFKFDPDSDAISTVIHFCGELGLAPPLYEYQHANEYGRIHCAVRIGDNYYTDYPEHYADIVLAKWRTAEVAVARLKNFKGQLILPELKGIQFLDELFNELLKHPNGVVARKLPEWYLATLRRPVPSNWHCLVYQSPRIRIEEGVASDLVFANIPINYTGMLPNLIPKLPKLKLPWADGHKNIWKMEITYCDNTTHVWARFNQQEYDRLEELLTLIGDHMSNAINQPGTQLKPVEGQLYLFYAQKCWQRVRILFFDEEKKLCKCFFVDIGQTMVLGCDALCKCPPHLLVLAAQAVCLSLYGLEDFEDHPYAQDVLANELTGHSVVVNVITTKEQFDSEGGTLQDVPSQTDESESLHVKRRRRASIIVEVNPNDKLHAIIKENICCLTPGPELRLEQKINLVHVSHVGDNGELKIQIHNSNFQFVMDSIGNFVSNISEHHRISHYNLLTDKYFLVYQPEVKQWHRAMLSTEPFTPKTEEFNIICVDVGSMSRAHIRNMYRLETNNTALAKFPAQCLTAHFYNVPPIDTALVKLLRSLLKPETPVILKVMEGNSQGLPLVNIFARGKEGLFLCLCTAIRAEYEVKH